MYTYWAFIREERIAEAGCRGRGLVAGGWNTLICCLSWWVKSGGGFSTPSKNSPGSVSGSPYTNSAEERPQSSLGAARSPIITQGSWLYQSPVSNLARSASFSCLWKRSTKPLACGWYAVVSLWLIPSFWQRPLQTDEVNCTPLSEVTTAGTPNLLTQPLRKAFTQSAVVVPASGMASGHLVLLSTTVNKWVWPGGWERPHEVNVYVWESPRRHVDGLDCRVHCWCRLTPGAGLAVPAHLSNLGAHLPPHKPRRNHLLAGSDAWMGDVVDGGEYLLPKADRHHWPSGYLGHITSQILSCGRKKFYL